MLTLIIFFFLVFPFPFHSTIYSNNILRIHRLHHLKCRCKCLHKWWTWIWIWLLHHYIMLITVQIHNILVNNMFINIRTVYLLILHRHIISAPFSIHEGFVFFPLIQWDQMMIFWTQQQLMFDDNDDDNDEIMFINYY